uniref:Transcriptional regulator n=1 Tax=Palpitomonas bilix TaxID=652834 RepID=A0A7S3DEJ2_9EUKA
MNGSNALARCLYRILLKGAKKLDSTPALRSLLVLNGKVGDITKLPPHLSPHNDMHGEKSNFFSDLVRSKFRHPSSDLSMEDALAAIRSYEMSHTLYDTLMEDKVEYSSRLSEVAEQVDVRPHDAIEPGTILLSHPLSMEHSILDRAVVLICQHSKKHGTLGVVLNKPLDFTLKDVLSADIEDHPSLGGEMENGEDEDSDEFVSRSGQAHLSGVESDEMGGSRGREEEVDEFERQMETAMSSFSQPASFHRMPKKGAIFSDDDPRSVLKHFHSDCVSHGGHVVHSPVGSLVVQMLHSIQACADNDGVNGSSESVMQLGPSSGANRSIHFGADMISLNDIYCKSGLAEEGLYRFFLGYSSWNPGQLEKEIKSGHWVTAKVSDIANAKLTKAPRLASKLRSKEVFPTEALILDRACAEGLWQKLLSKYGGVCSVWAKGSDEMYSKVFEESGMFQMGDDDEEGIVVSLS